MKAKSSMRESRERIELEMEVTVILRELGVPVRLRGYVFLREAIMMLVENMEIAGAITKVLYYDVAKMHKSTMTKVERSIRTAVEVSWERGNQEAFERIFGYSMKLGRRRPCNSEYMVQLADKIRLDRKVADNVLGAVV